MSVTVSIKNQLDEAAAIIRMQTARIAELEAENERLRAATGGAHSVLKLIYSDPDQPTGHRLKAAGLALDHETPRLQSVPPPLELVPEKPERPMHKEHLIRLERQNRSDAMSLEEREALISGCNGNGQDRDD